jgi:hypothetical protein
MEEKKEQQYSYSPEQFLHQQSVQFTQGNPMSNPKFWPQSDKVKTRKTPLADWIWFTLQLDRENIMPALKFFWVDEVQPKNYVKFLTPQFIPVAPYRSCSFLKKMEMYCKSNGKKMLKHIVKILRLNLDKTHIEYEPIHVKTGEVWEAGKRNPTVFMIPPNSLQSLLKNWYTDSIPDRPSSDLLVLHVAYQLFAKSAPQDVTLLGAHAVFVALKKYKGQKLVKLIALNPHGHTDTPGLYNDTEQERYKLMIKAIRDTLHVKVEQVYTSCPELQSPSQGGNCAQWFLFIFALFLSNPVFFDEPSSVLQTIRKQPNFNIQLFSLSLFLRTMPFVGLQKYYDFSFERPEKLIEQCFYEDDLTRSETFKEYSYSKTDDCYSQPPGRCPTNLCVQCSDSCHFKASVKHIDSTHCQPLSTTKMAEKMFQLYASLRNVTRQDSYSLTQDDIQRQLNCFFEPRTVEDVKSLYKLSDEDLEERDSLFRHFFNNPTNI